MYDELVKRLRDLAGEQMFDFERQPYLQAAASIEELSAICEEQKAQIILMAAEGKPRWIPVTERLPKENAPCIVYNKYYVPMIGWRVDGERFRIPGSRFPDHPTHWMPLPQPPKEE